MKTLVQIFAFCCLIATVHITEAQTPWYITGNAGISGTDFIGTTNNAGFRIRTNNQVRITVSSNGKVGIGNTSPVFKLDVKSGSINTDSLYRIGGNAVLSVPGPDNTFVGRRSGLQNTGIRNTAMGFDALSSGSTGNSNCAYGFESLLHNSSGNWNNAIGYDALQSNTTGSSNSAFGGFALANNMGGFDNCAYGESALGANKGGSKAVAIGIRSQQFTNDLLGYWDNTNTSVGYQSLMGATTPSMNTGLQNTALGREALWTNASGSNNTASGYQALYFNFDGSTNTAYGSNALYNNQSGGTSTAIGYNAMYNANNSSAGPFITGNVAVGYEALHGSAAPDQNIGVYNTAVGYQALWNATGGGSNTGIGTRSLNTNTSGFSNSAVGDFSLAQNTSGAENTAMGSSALSNNTFGWNNTAVGMYAGLGLPGVDFSQCTFIGSYSYPTLGRTNVTMLGYGIANAQCTGSNQVLLGNTAVASIRAQVTGITAYSDERFKTNIKDDVKGLDFIMKLKPVTYNENPVALHRIWGTPDSLLNKIDHSGIEKVRFIGFLAQDVAQAAKESGFEFPGIDVPKNENEVYSLRYTDFTMPLVKSVQELNGELKKQNEGLNAQLANEQSDIKALQLQLKQLQQDLSQCCTSYKQSSGSTGSENSLQPRLESNIPNPFTVSTIIKFYIPEQSSNGVIKIYSLDGSEIRSIPVNSKGIGQIQISAGTLAAGTYTYMLLVDGNVVDTKQMVLTK
jgi:hypothetical protein